MLAAAAGEDALVHTGYPVGSSVLTRPPRPAESCCALQYLKSIRLERNRKTGFKCPRGCGKGTKHPGPCPGKIDKSHPIHPRNEEQKKKKKVDVLAVVVVGGSSRQTKQGCKASGGGSAGACNRCVVVRLKSKQGLACMWPTWPVQRACFTAVAAAQC